MFWFRILLLGAFERVPAGNSHAASMGWLFIWISRMLWLLMVGCACGAYMLL